MLTGLELVKGGGILASGIMLFVGGLVMEASRPVTPSQALVTQGPSPAASQPAGSHTRWEYMLHDIAEYNQELRMKVLNKSGAEGWEAVGTTVWGNSLYVLLKRPLPPN